MNHRFSEIDARFMAQALRLAELGRGQTRPNPVVGAVLVKGGKVLARGFHRRAGLPHAEIEALSQLGMRAAGATLYVTLEPCCHRGRTSGRGIAILRRAGLRVEAGCLKDECWQQNRAFFSWVKNKRPWVTLKVASTLDGCIGDRQEKGRHGSERWITGRRAREAAHAMRAQHDAVLVGVGTILADNPRLTVRLPGSAAKKGAGPLRLVLDSHLRTPPTAALLGEARAKAPMIVAAKPRKVDRALRSRQRKLEAAGAEIWFAPASRDGRTTLTAVLRQLAMREVQSLLVEGGSQIHGAFVSAGLVDSVALFLAPRLVGSGVPVVEGTGLDWCKPATLGPLSVRALGDDLLITADVVTRGIRRRP